MPRLSFLDYINYFEDLAAKHVEIKGAFRWNLNEISAAMRTGTQLPVMLVDAPETRTYGNRTKTVHHNVLAFTILGKPNTITGDLDAYEAQNETLDYCHKICFDVEARILDDAEKPQLNGVKNWLYGMADKNSFHFFKVGPIFSDGLYGYRCELTLKNQVPTCPDSTKWSDL